MADVPHSSSVQSLQAHSQLPYSRPTTPVPHPHRVGFVGLGAMGYPIARNLANRHLRHQHGPCPLLVFNRSKAKADKLLAELGPEKVKVAESLEQIAKECDVVITSLATDEVVKATYHKFAEVLKDFKHDTPKIFVETSTIYPTVAGELDNILAQLPHTHFVTCPVFGPPGMAEKAKLVLAMSGDYRSKKEVAYILVPSVGYKVIDLGGNVEKAPTFKLLGNSIILGTIEVMAEAMTMAEKSGIGADKTLDLIKDIFPCPPMVNYGTKLVGDKFDGSTGFAIDGGIKDASHIRRLTNTFNSPMPLIDIAHQHLLTARALHQVQSAKGEASFETLDWSALIAGTRVAAGLEPFNAVSETRVVREE